MIVVDTNVLAYLLLTKNRYADVQDVLERDATWLAPSIWRSEFRNVLVQHVRQEIFTEDTAHEAWHLADKLVRTIAEPDSRRVLATAIARNLSAYDAEFVALAEVAHVRLVTDDREVLKRCSEVAVSVSAFGKGG